MGDVSEPKGFDVVVRGIPIMATEKSLNDFFRGVMERLGIEDWVCQKIGRRPFANIIFLEPTDGIKFLKKHGEVKGPFGKNAMEPGAERLQMDDRELGCCQSHRSIDLLAVRSLAMDQQKKIREKSMPKRAPKADLTKHQRSFLSSAIHCGIWDCLDTGFTFRSFLALQQFANLDFKNTHIQYQTGDMKRLDIPYHSIESIEFNRCTSTGKFMCTITLREPPRFSQPLTRMKSGGAQINSERERVSGMNEEHGNISGSCLVYRIILAHESIQIQRIKSLGQIHRLPPFMHRFVLTTETPGIGKSSFLREYSLLTDSLSPAASRLPFSVCYQLQKLAQNGYLPIDTVLKLLPHGQRIFQNSGERITLAVIRKLFQHIPWATPDADFDTFKIAELKEVMLDFEEQLVKNGLHSEEIPGELEGIAIIHKVQVTPSGILLYGPEAENNNRILRKYSQHHEFFLRVQFSDEDGNRLAFSKNTSNKPIYTRFQKILDEGIFIAGRQFSFLGFSHSSLRSQSCWFMAPFIYEGSLLYYEKLISGLGDFQNIRIPARCAARIGQAFSDTRDAITLPLNIKREIPDVKRNGRVFSDGCGTVSRQALDLIWAGLPPDKSPTVLQIRYQGAKGVLSLDTRLVGSQMCLRDSMTKFRGSDSADLEICTAGNKPITLYLNEQLIPILEKLGIPNEWFLDLQRTEIERLYSTTLTANNASKFLSSHSIGDKIGLPRFLKNLVNYHLSFQQDDFLTRVVETAVLIQLRTLKYKARIPVRKGFTLLGIMDETGILKEGQVFCIADIDGVSQVITGEAGRPIIISRSPALHPGDVQTATAVTVPSWSPLMRLRNCICFSQKGARDIPSMLSGGDLDGDLYHVIFDSKARIARPTYQPAEYRRQIPRELSQAVKREDMTKFFIEFMETDQLGRICNVHKMIADGSSVGITDPRCIKLAEMASTAVDFSKTGIPVRMNEMPTYSRIRPHFMAPGPHVEILKDKPISFVSEESLDDLNEDDEGYTAFKYYHSTRILGKLFDAVDEQEIFKRLQNNRILNTNVSKRDWNRSTSLLLEIWTLMETFSDGASKTSKSSWKSHIERARGIREEYGDSLLDLMFEYGPSPHLPVSEIEVFIGNIIGKAGAPTHRQREMSMSMKERFDDLLSWTVKRMTFQDEYLLQNGHPNINHDMHGVLVSTACLWCFLYDEPKIFDGGKKGSLNLRSFGYVAAAMCLRLMGKLSGSDK